MITSICNFISNNWDKIGMILVGFVAIRVYKMQKKMKRKMPQY